ncbi:hypothetical protein K1T71_003322 [Dendrolimus kikuchii]|uniref:Uncharacterized protein n=1 Tax=Dendrolimus kikuchii TaxID=765133 RepID=A0ACC1DCS9_9NEOP|nr:hypothetical protein K1T71_003322 [Dendrolimus kikuchii]
MKLSVLLLALCAFAAAAPKLKKHEIFAIDVLADDSPEGRNILVDNLVRQLIAFLRNLINNGSDLFGIPPLDPLEIDHFYLELPAMLLNLSLELQKINANGFGGFLVHRSNLNLRDLTFDIDISVPAVDISAELYDMVGDLFGAIPLYGKGKAYFRVENFRVRTLMHLKQSEDGQSILIDRFENTNFVIPNLKSEITGAIGGGDIDAIVNAMIEDVIIDYINRFQRPISSAVSSLAVTMLNPVLDQLDTWRYIGWLIPRN